MQATWWTDPTQLDDDQKKVVALGAGNHLVVGPPGSGKTNLLLLRATFLHKKSITNTVVLTFGRILNEFLATGVEHYPFSRSKIRTYNSWGTRLLAENGVTINNNQQFKDVRSDILTELQKLAKKKRLQDILDCVLIDEAQDYSADEIEVISEFSESVFAVGDEGQKIYSDKKGALKKIEQLGAQRSELRAHYRNGIQICRVADGIRNLIDDPDGLEATSNYDEESYPSSAEAYGGLTLNEQAQEAAAQIETQLQAYPDELIGILCPRIDDLDGVAAAMLNTNVGGSIQVQRQGAYVPLSDQTPVIITTIHGAKGLEYRAVHLMAADEIRRFSSKKNLAYTAATRAKTALSIYHGDGLPGWLEKGLSACKVQPQSDPDLDDLFL
jgi:superfamily I DNA/RNA helicase